MRLPLVITAMNRDSSTDRDSRLVNGMVELHGEEDYDIYKRPGFSLYQASVGTVNGNGVTNWLGDIYAIFGDTLYKNGVAVAGTVNTAGGRYTFDAILGATPKLFFKNTAKAYTYDSGAGIVNVTDADYPSTTVRGSVYIDGYTVVMNPTANIQTSASNDPTVWDPAATLVAQIEPDAGVAIAKQLVYVVAFKSDSTEFFYDAGNPTGSPLGPVQGQKVSMGCRHADSIANSEGVLFWIAKSRASGVSVRMMSSGKPDLISNESIDRLLRAGDYTTVYSWCTRINGHLLYAVTLAASNLTLVYDTKSKLWYQWTDSSGNYLPYVDMTFDSSQNAIFQHATNGALYKLDMANTTDAGSVFPVDIYTPNFDGGTRFKKMLNRINFVADQTPGSSLGLRASDDDYQTWSQFRTVDMGVTTPHLMNCGTFRRRAFHIRHQAATPMRIKSLELDILRGTN